MYVHAHAHTLVETISVLVASTRGDIVGTIASVRGARGTETEKQRFFVGDSSCWCLRVWFKFLISEILFNDQGLIDVKRIVLCWLNDKSKHVYDLYSNNVTVSRQARKCNTVSQPGYLSMEFGATQCCIPAIVGIEFRLDSWHWKPWSNTLDGHHGSSL